MEVFDVRCGCSWVMCGLVVCWDGTGVCEERVVFVFDERDGGLLESVLS